MLCFLLFSFKTTRLQRTNNSCIVSMAGISHAREPRAELEQRDSEDTIVRLDAYGTMERQEPDDDEDRDADAIASERERCPHRWPPR